MSNKYIHYSTNILYEFRQKYLDNINYLKMKPQDVFQLHMLNEFERIVHEINLELIKRGEVK